MFLDLHPGKDLCGDCFKSLITFFLSWGIKVFIAVYSVEDKISNGIG